MKKKELFVIVALAVLYALLGATKTAMVAVGAASLYLGIAGNYGLLTKRLLPGVSSIIKISVRHTGKIDHTAVFQRMMGAGYTMVFLVWFCYRQII